MRSLWDCEGKTETGGGRSAPHPTTRALSDEQSWHKGGAKFFHKKADSTITMDWTPIAKIRVANESEFKTREWDLDKIDSTGMWVTEALQRKAADRQSKEFRREMRSWRAVVRHLSYGHEPPSGETKNSPTDSSKSHHGFCVGQWCESISIIAKYLASLIASVTCKGRGQYKTLCTCTCLENIDAQSEWRKKNPNDLITTTCLFNHTTYTTRLRHLVFGCKRMFLFSEIVSKQRLPHPK